MLSKFFLKVPSMDQEQILISYQTGRKIYQKFEYWKFLEQCMKVKQTFVNILCVKKI